MTTFATQARDKALEIEKLLLKLRADITASRPHVKDTEAANLLTRLQSEMMLIGVDCAQLKCALSTATIVGEFRDRETSPHLHPRAQSAFPDHKCAAAHDLTLSEM